MLPKEIKPYNFLCFDENKKSVERQETKFNEEIIKKGYEAGFNKGYEAGVNEGFKKGYEEGLEKSQKEVKEKTYELVRATEIFKNLIKELTEFKQKQVEFFFPQILKLAFQIAEKIVATKISFDKEVTLSVVKEALKAVPLNEEKIIIKVNPEDYGFISQKIETLEIESARLQVEPSTEITHGGCSIETQSQHIVSTIEQRLKEIENALNSILFQ
ncbi:FliH/SctL family protein [Thermodesulfovibrio sp. 3907-1M]|uniref:Flagellar assembly protein FliH n=1 Tax=Thermodesulfovibrio autotrophicus TaxID=3118333 RepID=A0AAU8GU64_9BACT